MASHRFPVSHNIRKRSHRRYRHPLHRLRHRVAKLSSGRQLARMVKAIDRSHQRTLRNKSLLPHSL
jgi:hypothetical protein